MNRRFRVVAAIMPPKTVVPTDWRLTRPAPRASTNGRTPRMNASEVIRIGPQANARGFDRGIHDRKPALAQLFGELHNQNRILAGEADEHHQTDLAINVILQSAQRNRSERAQQRHRHRQQHDERQREALVLRGERQVDDQNPQSEEQVPRCSPIRVLPSKCRSIRSRSLSAEHCLAMSSIEMIASPELRPRRSRPVDFRRSQNIEMA